MNDSNNNDGQLVNIPDGVNFTEQESIFISEFVN